MLVSRLGGYSVNARFTTRLRARDAPPCLGTQSPPPALPSAEVRKHRRVADGCWLRLGGRVGGSPGAGALAGRQREWLRPRPPLALRRCRQRQRESRHLVSRAPLCSSLSRTKFEWQCPCACLQLSRREFERLDSSILRRSARLADSLGLRLMISKHGNNKLVNTRRANPGGTPGAAPLGRSPRQQQQRRHGDVLCGPSLRRLRCSPVRQTREQGQDVRLRLGGPVIAGWSVVARLLRLALSDVRV